MESAAEVLCPSQKHFFSNISLSGATVVRRIEELSKDIENSLRASKFVFYSVAIDESTDMTDIAQLAIFILGIDDNFEITEELAALYSMKGTTKGADIFKCIMMILNRYNIDFTKLSGIITDGASAMIGKRTCSLNKKSQTDLNLMQYHCIIHQQNVCAKKINFDHVMKEIIKMINFIRSRGLNHREFQNFLSN